MWRAKLEMNWDENRGPSSGTDRKWNDRPATQGIPFPAQENPMIDSNVGKITIQIYPDETWVQLLHKQLSHIFFCFPNGAAVSIGFFSGDSMVWTHQVTSPVAEVPMERRAAWHMPRCLRFSEVREGLVVMWVMLPGNLTYSYNIYIYYIYM